jgi:formate/nitrite transporter
MGGGSTMSIVIGPKEGYAAIVDKGEQLCQTSLVKIFALSTFAGCFIGFGALLSLTISGNIDPMVKAIGTGVQGYLYAMLFPVNLLFILLSGSILYTGATFTTPSAWIEGRAKLSQCVAVIVVAWIGNLVGGFGFAILTELCGLNEGGVAKLAVKVLESKTTKGFGIIFLRGIGCNWLVCMAVFLQTLAQDMTGKYVGIIFPISTFVACGFEHYPANAYALPLAWLATLKDAYKEPGQAGWGEILANNLIPCTLGNLVAGVIIMSFGFSYFYGSLNTCPPPGLVPKKAEEDGKPNDPQVAAVEEWRKGMAAMAAAPAAPQAQPGPSPPAPPTTERPSWVDAIPANNAGFARTVSC